MAVFLGYLIIITVAFFNLLFSVTIKLCCKKIKTLKIYVIYFQQICDIFLHNKTKFSQKIENREQL